MVDADGGNSGNWDVDGNNNANGGNGGDASFFYFCKTVDLNTNQRSYKTPDEVTLVSERREDIVKNCPKCNQISSYSGTDFYWINPSKLE